MALTVEVIYLAGRGRLSTSIAILLYNVLYGGVSVPSKLDAWKPESG